MNGLGADFYIENTDIGKGQLDVAITHNGLSIPAQISPSESGKFRISFKPIGSGTYVIKVYYDGQEIQGSPFMMEVIDAKDVKSSGSGLTSAEVGQRSTFNVNLGPNVSPSDIKINITSPRGGYVQPNIYDRGGGNIVVEFTPTEAGEHLIDVRYLDKPANGSPFSCQVTDGNQILMLHIPPVGSVNRPVEFETPNGELVPSKMILQPDGDYKLDYMSKYTGRHRVEITSSGQPVMGSPFYVEIYDPNKIKIDGNPRGMVGEQMQFDIKRDQAGKAELKVSIKGPRGNLIRYEMFNTTNGERVWYTPTEPGVHQIFVLFGGLSVPGCPVKQDIFDSSIIIAEGEGLIKGLEDHQATFFVDPRGQKGELKVQVEGPNSVAKTTVTQDYDGRYEVKYVPMEPGMFMITIKWNGKEIEGSPFRARISPLQKVGVVGGWDSLLDVNNNMTLRIDEAKSIDFDTRGCGQGQLTASLVGPSGVLPVDVRMREKEIYTVSFTPREEGEYRLKVFWNGQQLDRSPIIGFTKREVAGTSEVDGIYTKQQRSMTSTTTYQAQQEGVYSIDKVVLTGIGLQQAVVGQSAEFHIDGTAAGPGVPTVKIDGPSGDVNVQCLPINPCVYKCTYYPPIPGIYSIDIRWADRMVYGSPFKVNAQPIYGSTVTYQMPKNVSPYLMPGNPQMVMPSTEINQSRSMLHNQMTSTHLNVIPPSQSGSVTGGNSRAQKVSYSGEGLSGARVGREAKVVINTTRAGNGVLTAQCNGQTRAARCRLLDPNDSGIYQLFIEPLEGGHHNLQIKFNKEHVAGSPYIFKVPHPSDPTKVKCSGPGLKSGVWRNFRPTFVVDTAKAGPGHLGLNITGPRGGVTGELSREDHTDKKIVASYSPTEPGDYVIRITWSGEDVTGSPFAIRIAETDADLNYYLQRTASPKERFRNAR